MNKEDIIRMAREAGFHKWYTQPEEHPDHVAIVERFAAQVAAEKDKQIAFLKDSHDAIRELAYKTGVEAEREACAKLCDGWTHANGDDCAAAIRARGEA